MKHVYVSMAGIGAGVFWAAWEVHGFWWGLLYGIGSHAWLGYRLASWLLR